MGILGKVGKAIVSPVKDMFGVSDDAGSAQYAAAIAALAAVGVPEIEAQKIILESPELVGELVPELETLLPELRSTMEGVSVPQELKTAQLNALSGLEERAAMGLTPEDEAVLRQTRRGAVGETEARDAAILQNLEQRGMLGGGLELASRQASAQNALQGLAEASDRQAAMNFANKMAAQQAAGQMAGSMRGQEFGEQSDVAKARDAFAQANRAYQSGVAQRNIGSKNQAQAMNLASRQQAENQRAALENQQEMYNKGLIQQKFQNDIQRAGGQAAAMQSLGGLQQQQNIANQQMMGQFIGGGAQVAGAAMMASDKNLKTNIDMGDDEIESMLDNLDAYEYDYKPEVNDPGRKLSVMAQDLEKSNVGDELVEDAEMGKMVDYGKAAPVMMAATANLNKRMRKLEKLIMGEKDDER